MGSALPDPSNVPTAPMAMCTRIRPVSDELRLLESNFSTAGTASTADDKHSPATLRQRWGFIWEIGQPIDDDLFHDQDSTDPRAIMLTCSQL